LPIIKLIIEKKERKYHVRKCNTKQSYKAKIFPSPLYDGWLDSWQNLFRNPQGKVLEIGVGSGPNLEHFGAILQQNIWACDVAPSAIDQLQKRHPRVNAFLHDMTQPFPFGDRSFDYIVSDLSLHYFDQATTESIESEILRLCRIGGYFFVRVNRVGDEVFGYGQGEEIETDFFELSQNRKRFFSKTSLQSLFEKWESVRIIEMETCKYRQSKNCVVGVFRKKDS